MDNPVAATPARRMNTLGIVGLCMVVAGTILSPSGFLGLTLPVIALLGFGGMAACLASLAWRPRWPGVTGLTLGVLCIGFWSIFFLWGFLSVRAVAAANGLGVADHAQASMSAMVLVETVEAQRTIAGAPPAMADLSKVDPRFLIDPWGRPYRYQLTGTARGFAFMSDGADGIAGSGDDIDILTLEQPMGAFELPPISVPTAPPAAPATP